jgi:predicted component of type VI protein secretion system
MFANLFDRFGPEENVGPEAIATELADMLGGRRTFADASLGVLSWGLPSLLDLTADSAAARQHIAACIADAIDRFAPCLENVSVTPVEGVREFAFVIDAALADDTSTIQVRVLSPNIGGALGARVEVMDMHGP